MRPVGSPVLDGTAHGSGLRHSHDGAGRRLRLGSVTILEVDGDWDVDGLDQRRHMVNDRVERDSCTVEAADGRTRTPSSWWLIAGQPSPTSIRAEPFVAGVGDHESGTVVERPEGGSPSRPGFGIRASSDLASSSSKSCR